MLGLILFLSAPYRKPATTVGAEQRADEARAEEQATTAVPTVRTGNPIPAVRRRHGAQRTGTVVAIAAGREEYCFPLFIWFSIEIPSFIKAA